LKKASSAVTSWLEELEGRSLPAISCVLRSPTGFAVQGVTATGLLEGDSIVVPLFEGVLEKAELCVEEAAAAESWATIEAIEDS